LDNVAEAAPRQEDVLAIVTGVGENLDKTDQALGEGKSTPPLDDKHLFRPQLDGDADTVSIASDQCTLPVPIHLHRYKGNTITLASQTDNITEELSQIIQCSMVEDKDVPPPGCDINLSRPISPSCMTDFPGVFGDPSMFTLNGDITLRVSNATKLPRIVNGTQQLLMAVATSHGATETLEDDDDEMITEV
jgi:hypothetical protein